MRYTPVVKETELVIIMNKLGLGINIPINTEMIPIKRYLFFFLFILPP